jgi:hypothetical protein
MPSRAVTLPSPGLDYTRVSDDTAILCRRQDFPRAVNVLQRRAPDHRRWRYAFQRVAATSSHALVGARRAWMSAAFRDVVAAVAHPWLQRELAIDLSAAAPDFSVEGVLPTWTARGLWREADAVGLPMAYVAQVTSLPRGIDGALDTARVVLDFRRTALAHRDCAIELASRMPHGGPGDALPMDQMLLRLQIESQRDAAERWRALARRLLMAGIEREG